MKAYLWHGVEKVSDYYHCGGSVLIEARSLERARQIAVIKYENNKEIPMSVSGQPDAIFESGSTEERVWVFPDAGCCQ